MSCDPLHCLTLMERAAHADAQEIAGLDIPEELARRESRLEAIGRAKAGIHHDSGNRNPAPHLAPQHEMVPQFH